MKKPTIEQKDMDHRKDALNRMELAAALLCEQKKTPLGSRELSIALTELESALLWLREDLRRNSTHEKTNH